MNRRSSLLPIFLIVLVDVLGLTMVIPLLPVYAESFHATPLLATLLVPTYAACQLVSGPLLGKISDRTGRRPMLLVSQAGTLLGFLLMARASSLWMIYAARALDGATAGNLSLVQAYIADNTAPEDRTKSFAIIGISFGLGFLVGPAITAYLSTYGLNVPIYGAACLSATSLLCTTLLLPREKPPAPLDAADLPAGRRLGLFEWRTYGELFTRPILRGLLLQFFLYMLAFATFQSGFPLFAERRFTWDGHPFTPREIGIVFAWAGFLGIVIQGGLLGRLAKTLGEAVLVAFGFCAILVGNGLLSETHSLGLLALVTTISSLGNSVLRPALTSLVTQVAERHEQGVVLGLTQSLSSIAAIVAPPLAGFLIGEGRLATWALVAATAAAGGLLATRSGSAAVRRRTTLPSDGARER